MQAFLQAYGWYIGQGLSFIAMSLTILSLQCKKISLFYCVQIGSSAIFLISYLFLGGNAGMYFNVFALVRSVMLFALGKREANRVGQVFLVALLAGCAVPAFFGDGWIAVFPFLGQLTGTVGMWSRNGQKMRVAQITLVSPLWLTYSCIKVSWGGIGCEAFNMVSVVVSVIRHGWRALGGDGTEDEKTGTEDANGEPVCEKTEE